MNLVQDQMYHVATSGGSVIQVKHNQRTIQALNTLKSKPPSLPTKEELHRKNAEKNALYFFGSNIEILDVAPPDDDDDDQDQSIFSLLSRSALEESIAKVCGISACLESGDVQLSEYTWQTGENSGEFQQSRNLPDYD